MFKRQADSSRSTISIYKTTHIKKNVPIYMKTKYDLTWIWNVNSRSYNFSSLSILSKKKKSSRNNILIYKTTHIEQMY